MNDRNIGRFTVTTDCIRRNPDEAAQVFKMLNLVVVRAECMFADSKIEYTGISDQFIEIEMGTAIPEYRLEITSEEDTIVKVVANRLN
jgi:hypothetical protein